MKKMMMALGRFMYGTWYGAMVVYAAVAVLLLGLQLANSGFGDIIAWPKGLHIILMLIVLANLGGAMLFSLSRRRFRRGVVQFLLCGVAFFGCIFLGFIIYCIPTRMVTPPSDELVDTIFCESTHIAKEKLVFLGGLSAREPVIVYEVAETPIDEGRFFSGSPWTGEVGAKAVAHYRHIMEFCRIGVSLPDDAALSFCNVGQGDVTLIKAGAKRYLVYERL